MKAARELGLRTVALTGAGGQDMAEHADIFISVPSSDTARIQEACLQLGHSACELVEQAVLGDQAAS